MLYAHTLAVHSLVRWIVIILGIVAVVRGIAGLRERRVWTSTDGQVGLGFTLALDAQVVLGLVLFLLLSPVTTQALQDLGLTMRTGVLRFWTVEHPLLMIGAVAVAHIGRNRTRRQPESRLRHRAATIFFAFALVLVLAGTPWPFLPYGRPLLPFL